MIFSATVWNSLQSKKTIKSKRDFYYQLLLLWQKRCHWRGQHQSATMHQNAISIQKLYTRKKNENDSEQIAVIPPWHQCQTCLIICISINYEGEIWNLLFHLVDLQSCTKAVFCCILLKSLDMKDRLLSLQLMPQLLWWVNTEYSGIATPTWKDHKLENTVHKAIKQGLPPSLFRDLQRYRQNRDNIQQLNNPEASRKSPLFFS